MPQRTCVACKEIRPKRELVRLVRTVAGPLEIDPTGKKAGRGAYLCRSRDCWARVLKQRTLEHALKTALTDDDKETLRAYAQTLPSTEAVRSD